MAGTAWLAACTPPPEKEPIRVLPVQNVPPARASVTDLGAFSEFIATRPTVEALRARYPGLLVILPGQIATKEFRSDNSRYFPVLDEQGRVIGGSFQ